MNLPRQHDWMPTENDSVEGRVGEDGFMLLAVVVMVALLLIALSVAAPVVARQLQRTKEIESQHRMEQYVRAIQLYQRKFPGQYPASIKILEKTNNVRFLRHVYVDPLTGKADYRLIHQGEQKTKIHVFFGQELDGLAASLGSAAGMQSGGGIGGVAGGATNVTATNALNSGFGGAAIGTNGTPGSSGTTGTNGSSSTDASNTDALGDGNIGLIVGVGTSKTGTSITQPNGQTTYETWEYWYDPRIEMLKRNVNVTGGGVTSQAASTFGQDVSGQSNAGGSGLNGATTGTSGTTGTNGAGNTSTPNNPNSNPF